MKIQKDLDIGSKGMSKIMNVTPVTFNKKKSDKCGNHSFNENNYKSLIEFLKNYIKKYKLYK